MRNGLVHYHSFLYKLFHLLQQSKYSFYINLRIYMMVIYNMYYHHIDILLYRNRDLDTFHHSNMIMYMSNITCSLFILSNMFINIISRSLYVNNIMVILMINRIKLYYYILKHISCYIIMISNRMFGFHLIILADKNFRCFYKFLLI